MEFKQGQVVKVTKAGHPYEGQEAVVQWWGTEQLGIISPALYSSSPGYPDSHIVVVVRKDAVTLVG